MEQRWSSNKKNKQNKQTIKPSKQTKETNGKKSLVKGLASNNGADQLTICLCFPQAFFHIYPQTFSTFIQRQLSTDASDWARGRWLAAWPGGSCQRGAGDVACEFFGPTFLAHVIWPMPFGSYLLAHIFWLISFGSCLLIHISLVWRKRL